MTSRALAVCCCAALLTLVLAGCGGNTAIPPATTTGVATNQLTVADVQSVVQNAALSVSAPVVISVTDRAGHILALYSQPGAPATSTGNFSQTVPTDELSVALARTAAYFSNDQAPLSSRTVRFISGIHFPPGITNAPNAALYGIENTNRGCPLNVTFLPGQAIAPARSISGLLLGLGITTGKTDIFDSNPNAVNPGGVPLFKNGRLVGGIGVAGASPAVSEFAAFSCAVNAGFGATPAAPGVVVIDGISLPFVSQTTRPAGVNTGVFAGILLAGPIASPGPVPEGDLVQAKAGLIGGL